MEALSDVPAWTFLLLAAVRWARWTILEWRTKQKGGKGCLNLQNYY